MNLLGGLQPINILKAAVFSYPLYLALTIVVRFIFKLALKNFIKNSHVINLMAVIIPSFWEINSTISNPKTEPILKILPILLNFLVFITLELYDSWRNKSNSE